MTSSDGDQAFREHLRLLTEAHASVGTPERAASLQRVAGKLTGIERSLDLAVRREDAEGALRLAAPLGAIWEAQGHISEGRAWFVRVLAMPGASRHPKLLAHAMQAAGVLAFRQRDQVLARQLGEQSVRLARQEGDRELLALTLTSLARTNLRDERHDDVRTCAEEALALYGELGQRTREAGPLHMLAYSAHVQRDLDRAAELYVASLQRNVEAGNAANIAGEHYNLGILELQRGNIDRAREHLTRRVELTHEQGREVMLGYTLLGLAGLALHEGRPERSARLLGTVSAHLSRVGTTLDPGAQLTFDEYEARLKAQLGAERTAALQDEGRTFPAEEALVGP